MNTLGEPLAWTDPWHVTQQWTAQPSPILCAPKLLWNTLGDALILGLDGKHP